MNRKRILVFAFLFLPTILCAMSPQDVTEPMTDQDIVVLSKGAQTGDFSQTKTITGITRTLKSSGTVKIVPGYGIVWYTVKPYASKLVVGSDYVIQQVMNREPTVLDASENKVFLLIAESLESIFFGDLSKIKASFKVYFLRQSGDWYMKLEPSDKTLGSFIKYIFVTGSEQLESLLMVETSGDSILYEFQNMIRQETTDALLEDYRR